MKKKKYAPWWGYLLLIPLQLVIDCVVFIIVLATSDSSFGLILPTLLLLGILTAMVLTSSIYKAIASVKSRRLGGEAAFSYKTDLALWQYWLPLLVQTPLFFVVVVLVGSYEVNKFYADPNHIGFAIPIMTLCLAAYLLLMELITFLLCGYRSAKASEAKSPKHKKER